MIPRSHLAIIVALLAFHLVNTLVWLQLDQMLPFDDSAFHLLGGLKAAEIFSTPVREWFGGLLDIGVEGFYPPLFHICMGVFNVLLGPSPTASQLANLPFWAVLLCSLYGMGRKIGHPHSGLVAGWLVSVYPYVFGLSKMALPDFAVTAMVTWSVSCLLATDGFSKRAASVCFGVSLGLGMLTKQVFAAFVLPPMMVAVVEALRQPRQPTRHLGRPTTNSGQRLVNVGLALGIGLLIAGWWYLRNVGIWFPSYLRLLRASDPAIVLDAHGGIFAIESLLYYGRELIDNQMLPFCFSLFLAGAFVVWRSRGKWKWYLVWAILGPYAIFTLILLKEPKTTVPYLPIMALVSAMGVCQIRLPRVRRSAEAVIVLVGLWQYLAISYFVPLTPRYLSLSHRLVLPVLAPPHLESIREMRHFYVDNYFGKAWPIDELLWLLEREQPPGRAGVVAVSDPVGIGPGIEDELWLQHHFMTNEKTLMYYFRLRGLDYSVLSLSRGSCRWMWLQEDWPDVFVVNEELEGLIPKAIVVHYALIQRLAMPDLSPVYVYRRRLDV